MFPSWTPKTVLARVSFKLTSITRIRLNRLLLSWTATVTSVHDGTNSRLPGTPLAPSLGFFRRKSDFFHPVRIFRSRARLFRHLRTDLTGAVVSAIATAG